FKKMSKGSREVIKEEIESHMPPVPEQTTITGLGAVKNAFKNVFFFTMMTQMFD
ncbi:hypothetical protein J1N35_014730, partial [Gossypium stocksii]